MIATVLAWSSSLIAVFTLPKALALSCGLFGVAAAAAFGASLALGRTLWRPLAFGLLVIGAGAWFSGDAWAGLVGHYNAYAYGLWGLSLCAFAHLAAASLPAEWTGRLESVLGALAAGLGAHATLESAGLISYLERSLPSARAVSTIGSPVFLGAFLAGALPLSVDLALRRRGLWIAGPLAAAAGLAATYSRGAWIAAGVGLGFYAWVRWFSAHARGLIVVGVLGAAAVGAGALAVSGGRGDRPRLEMMNAAWTGFLEQPLLGVGPDRFEPLFRLHARGRTIQDGGRFLRPTAHAHNEFLNVLATTGSLGFGALLWLLLAVAAAVREQLGADRRAAAVFGAGLAAILVNLQVNPGALVVFLEAAVLSGLLCARRAALPTALSRPARIAFVAAAAMAAALSWKLVRADWLASSAARLADGGRVDEAVARLGLAARASPYELSYRVSLIASLGHRIAATKDPARRLGWLGELEHHAREIVRRRPLELKAHYAAGGAWFIHAQLGRAEALGWALAAYDEAVRLDPHHLPSFESRLRAAQFSKDPALIARAGSELARVRAAVSR